MFLLCCKKKNLILVNMMETLLWFLFLFVWVYMYFAFFYISDRWLQQDRDVSCSIVLLLL